MVIEWLDSSWNMQAYLKHVNTGAGEPALLCLTPTSLSHNHALNITISKSSIASTVPLLRASTSISQALCAVNRPISNHPIPNQPISNDSISMFSFVQWNHDRWPHTRSTHPHTHSSCLHAGSVLYSVGEFLSFAFKCHCPGWFLWVVSSADIHPWPHDMTTTKTTITKRKRKKQRKWIFCQ